MITSLGNEHYSRLDKMLNAFSFRSQQYGGELTFAEKKKKKKKKKTSLLKQTNKQKTQKTIFSSKSIFHLLVSSN
jgi:L-lactate utilization protein LutB